MAGVSIHIRCDLASEPEVIDMAMQLAIGPDLVVGKLVRLWGHNGHFRNPETVDNFLGFAGFAAAMAAVGWLRDECEAVVFPVLDKYECPYERKRRLAAGRQARRRAKAENVPCHAPVTLLSRSCHAPVTLKNENGAEVIQPAGILAYLPAEFQGKPFSVAWSKWLAHRKQQRLKSYTEIGFKTLAKKLSAWGVEGSIASIEQSIGNNWQGLFPSKDGENGLFSGVAGWYANRTETEKGSS